MTTSRKKIIVLISSLFIYLKYNGSEHLPRFKFKNPQFLALFTELSVYLGKGEGESVMHPIHIQATTHISETAHLD